MSDYQPQPRIHIDNLYRFVDEARLAELLEAGLVREGDAPALYVPTSDKALEALRAEYRDQ